MLPCFIIDYIFPHLSILSSKKGKKNSYDFYQDECHNISKYNTKLIRSKVTSQYMLFIHKNK